MTPEEALDVLESDENDSFERRRIMDKYGNFPYDKARRVLEECIRDAKKWRANKDAVYCANAMLQAARPTILNMLNCEQAVKDYER